MDKPVDNFYQTFEWGTYAMAKDSKMATKKDLKKAMEKDKKDDKKMMKKEMGKNKSRYATDEEMKRINSKR